MRLSINHRTGFRYSAPVRSSYNEARMTPATTDQQTVWSSRVAIAPVAWSFGYTDYWGTAVTTFELHDPHERMTVHAQSVVQTRSDEVAWDIERRVAETDLSWAELASAGRTDTMAEFLVNDERTEPADELATLARQLVGDSPRLTGLDICTLVHDRLTYRRGATEVNSSAREAWETGAGVCQDYSHIALGALRSVGLPARYVSGYLHPGGVEPHATVAAESHAWVEWWCGAWIAYDPTWRQRLNDRYVRVGQGRDYRDVAPLRGTFSGGGESEMFVTVEMTELG